jgi:hypothetical protein
MPLLSEPSAIMKEMKDLAVDGAVGTPPSDTLRPFVYNIQRHMTEKVQQLRHFLQAALPFKYWRKVRCFQKEIEVL